MEEKVLDVASGVVEGMLKALQKIMRERYTQLTDDCVAALVKEFKVQVKNIINEDYGKD